MASVLARLLQSDLPLMMTVRSSLMSVLLCTALCLLCVTWVYAQDQTQKDAEARAESEALYSLAEFVQWPDAANLPGAVTFNFCVLGQDPLGQSLDEVVLGHPVGEKPTMIVRGNNINDLGRCDVLFVSSSETKRLPKILPKLRDRSTLTVSDIPSFATDGGIIQLSKNDARISFVINMDASQRAHLNVRAQLLALATVVHEDGSSTKKNDLNSRE